MTSKVRSTGRVRALLIAAAIALVVASAAGAAPGDPIANDDFVTTTIGQPVAFNVLANDLDAEGGTLTVDRIDEFTGADPLLLSLSSDASTGAVEFEPRSPFTGVFGFRYVVVDEDGNVAKAHVRVSVREVDVPTVAGDGAYDVDSGRRTHFEFSAGPAASAVGSAVAGTFSIQRFRGEHITFDGAVTSLEGSGPDATMSGTGTWNGTPGYTFTVTLVEKGDPGGYKGDRLGVEVLDPSGTVVYSTGGANPISGGNVSVL
jgi:hypothetical protein